MVTIISWGRLRLLLFFALADEAPAAALPVTAEVEDLAREAGRTAAAPLECEAQWDQLGAALGVSAEAAESRGDG